MNLREVKHALSFIPAQDRDIWFRVGAALKTEFGKSGLEVFDQWSQSAENYSPSSILSTWRSLIPHKISMGTVIRLARKNGFDGTVQPHSKQNCSVPSSENQKTSRLAQDRVAKNCRDLWKRANSVDTNHPYIVEKQVHPEGIRQHGTRLLIPLFDQEKVMRSLQFTNLTGEKWFEPGSQTKACYCPIDGDEQVLICEGWATGKTLHEHLGANVFCAMSAYNLLAVGRVAKQRYPDLRMTIVADNDRGKAINVGVEAAKKAAEALNCDVWIPKFEDHEVGSDFNDWVRLRHGK